MTCSDSLKHSLTALVIFVVHESTVTTLWRLAYDFNRSRTATSQARKFIWHSQPVKARSSYGLLAAISTQGQPNAQGAWPTLSPKLMKSIPQRIPDSTRSCSRTRLQDAPMSPTSVQAECQPQSQRVREQLWSNAARSMLTCLNQQRCLYTHPSFLLGLAPF